MKVKNITLIIALPAILIAQSKWHFFAGVNENYINENINQSVNKIPLVNAHGDVNYLKSTVNNVFPILILEDNNYNSVLGVNKKIPGFFVGMQTKINPYLNFRAKATHQNSTYNIIDTKNSLYTIDNTSINNIMNQSTETITIEQKPYNSISIAVLYNFSERLSSGLMYVHNKQNYDLTLNGNNTTTFKPNTSELGIESLYKISDYINLSTSISINQDKTYFKRLLNFSLTQNPDQSYKLNYIAVDNNNPWQACTGYLIAGNKCSSANNSSYVNNYYYDINTPQIYGTTISTNNINSTIGPAIWYKRYLIKASIGIEIDYSPNLFNFF